MSTTITLYPKEIAEVLKEACTAEQNAFDPIVRATILSVWDTLTNADPQDTGDPDVLMAQFVEQADALLDGTAKVVLAEED